MNHSIAILLSDSNLCTRSEIVFAQAESVLSSAKLWVEENSMKKKSSLIENPNRSGPTIEPCGIPVMIFSKLLYMLFIQTYCFKYEKINCKAVSSKPKAANLAIIKSCDMQYNALDKSINIAPTM